MPPDKRLLLAPKAIRARACVALDAFWPRRRIARCEASGAAILEAILLENELTRVLFGAALGLCLLCVPVQGSSQDIEIFAIRYGSIADFPLRGLLPDAPEGEVIDVTLTVWLVRSGDRVILIDTGFFRPQWFGRFDIRDFVRPDVALSGMGVSPADVTDVVITHAHWDHMGGLELFPAATVWIQDAEFSYYTGTAWQSAGRSGGIDPADVAHLVSRNTSGSLRLIPGDGIEILPGITVFTGARHTFASQYVLVDGAAPFVIASDNAYLYKNIIEGRAGATFERDDRQANLEALRRMVELAGDAGRVIPGHDAEVFRRFPLVADGIVRIYPEHP